MRSHLLAPSSCLLSLFVGLAVTAQPALSSAQAEPASATTQSEAPVHRITEVETWVKPQPGWLYVLDSDPDTGGPGGRVWLVDPDSGKVMGSIRTGDYPDFALSSDGSRLYVASTKNGDASELAVIDTAAGSVLKSGVVNGRAVTDGLPGFSTMAVSGDGLALRILIDAPKSEDHDAFLYATFDTRAGEFLPGIVHLGNCGPGRFIFYPTADHFDVLCPRTNRIRMIRADADSHTTQNVDVELPWRRRDGVGEALELPGSQDMNIVRGDGAVVAMDTAMQTFTDTPAHGTLPNRVPPAAWPTSPDGNRLYLGYISSYDHSDNRFYLDYGRPPNVRPGNETADQFRVLDTHTWKKIGTIKTKMTFWSAVTSSDGKTLYALAPQKHSILVIDTAKMHQTRAFKVGGAPALALVVP